jgi:pimeloyl-ACP methyl ester carboxylesterase
MNLQHGLTTSNYNFNFFAFFISLIFLCLTLNCQAEIFKEELCPDSTSPVHQRGFVNLGGIEQWVTIDGDHCASKVILFLHGGPGSPLSPYAQAIYGEWQKEFILVQWDQRGAGKTFIRNPATATSPLTMAQMVDDGLALVNYLQQTLGQQKVILMGSSWGAALGIAMVQKQPELFHAFIASSPLLSYSQNPIASYQKILEKAQKADDQQNLDLLQKLGPPPWSKPNGTLRRVSRQYEALLATAAPSHWWVAEASYEMERRAAEYEAADDYSFIQFVGFHNDGIYAGIDFPKTATRFALPIYFVQGEEDLVTVPEVTKTYFNKISAPSKALVLVPKTGHGPNEASVAAEYQFLKKILSDTHD